MKKETENCFYNASIKNNFLRENISGLKRYEALFNTAYDMETELNKDLSDFNSEEITDLFQRSNWVNVNTAKAYKSAIKVYFNWCKLNLPNFNNDIRFFNIKNDSISLESFKENCLFISVGSVLEMLDVIETNMPKGESWDINIVALFYTELMRNGVKIEEIMEIKKSDLDFGKGAINVNSRLIPINSRLLEYLKYYLYNHISKDSEYLFRTQKSAKITSNSIISKITRLNKYLKELGYPKTVSKKNMEISYLFRTLDLYSLTYYDVNSFDVFTEVLKKENADEFIQQKYYDLYRKYKDGK